MSVVGVGIDIVAVARITELLERHGARFLERCFRPDEISRYRESAPAIAARWAAKEALLKALGADVRHIPYHDIEVVKSDLGPVEIRLHGLALEAMEVAGGNSIHLSVSHERETAVATVLIEG